MLKISYEGQDYEFVGYVRYPKESGATHYLSAKGTMEPANNEGPCIGTPYFRLVPVRHTFGGIVFEETETRQAQPDEWWWGDKRATLQLYNPTIGEFPILKPVEVLHEDD